MAMHEHFRQALVECDVALARKIWAHVNPGMPQPRTDAEALFSIHYARTIMETIHDNLRCYSHAWLVERRLPSGLPDRLKPVADRLYPRVVEGVGIAVKSLSPGGSDLVVPIREAMEDAVKECYADGETDPQVIKARMSEARRKVRG